MSDAAIASSSRYAVEAMATRFELVFARAESHAARTRAIAEDALGEIVALERRLSRFLPASAIAAINAHAGSRPVKIDPELFALLERCVALSEATDGAFDITIGPLSTLWKSLANAQGAPHAPHAPRTVPTADEVADARARVGYRYLLLDPDCSTVCFARDGMSLDLGAAGKGYAIDRAIDTLRSHGITNALLHGGTSGIHALGRAQDGQPWNVRWNDRVFELSDRALSVSAVHGTMFCANGKFYGHVVDPRTGCPTEAAASVVVTGVRSLECDALSTAFLVLGDKWLPQLRERFPGYCVSLASAGRAI